MQRNLLQIVTAAQLELGLPVSTSVINNTDVTTQQMLGLLQAVIDDFRQKHDWTVLQQEYNLVVNTPITTTGTLTVNSPIITGLSSTVGLTANNFIVSANAVPLPSRILTIDSPTQITMTMEATGTATTQIVFAQDTYPEPSDFDHFINRTWYDRTNRWQLLGPDSPQQDQFVRSGIVALGPRRHFRQLGAYPNSYRLWPAPYEIVSPLQIVFEYISNNCVYVLGSSNNRSSFLANDTDVPYFDYRALVMGLKAAFWAQKGMNANILMAAYDSYVDRLKSRDGGAPTLSMVPRNTAFLVDSNNVQDSNFPTNSSSQSGVYGGT